MPSRVENLTKIIDVKEVEWYGDLEYNWGDGGWGVRRTNGKFEDFGDWFDKLLGKKVRVTIKNLQMSDDSELLEEETK